MIKREELTPEIFRELLELGLHRSGASQAHTYFSLWKDQPLPLAYGTRPLKLVTYRKNKQIVGWSIIVLYSWGNPAIWTFVKDEERRKGIGSKLVIEIQKDWNKQNKAVPLAAWQGEPSAAGFYQSFSQKFDYL